jgi:hypothetical protein
VAVSTNAFFNGIQLPVLSSWTSAGRFKCALFSASPGALSVSTYAGLSNELATANGYTVGGTALPATLSNTVTEAASWGSSWTSSTVYAVNQIVKSTGAAGFLFRCVTAGTAGGSAPTQTTEGALDTSSTGAQFVNCGQSIEVWTSGVPTWTASGGSIAAAYAVIYDSTAGDNLLLINFGGTTTATAGNNFTVTPDATYGWFSTLPQ